MPGMDAEQGYIPPKIPFITTYRSTDYNTLSLPYKHLSRNSSKASLPPNYSPTSPRSPLIYRRNSDFSVSSRGSRRRKAPPIHYLPALIAVILFTVTIVAWSLSAVPCGIPHLCRERFINVLARNTGTYAPFQEQHYHGLPATCKVDQVSIVRSISSPGKVSRYIADLAVAPSYCPVPNGVRRQAPEEDPLEDCCATNQASRPPRTRLPPRCQPGPKGMGDGRADRPRALGVSWFFHQQLTAVLGSRVTRLRSVTILSCLPAAQTAVASWRPASIGFRATTASSSAQTRLTSRTSSSMKDK